MNWLRHKLPDGMNCAGRNIWLGQFIFEKNLKKVEKALDIRMLCGKIRENTVSGSGGNMMFKRVLALLMVLCVVAAVMLPVAALAAGEVHTQENGNVVYEEEPSGGFSLNSLQMILVEAVIVIGVCVGVYFLCRRKK